MRSLAHVGTAALLLSGGTVLGSAAWAAFNSTSGSGSSTWSTGVVSLGGATPASAVFDLTGLLPGSFGSSCIVVDYTGSVPAGVRVYSTATSGGLASYLTWQVEEGSGSSSSCTGFSATAVDYNPTDSTAYTLADFASGASSYATGVGSWAPSAPASKDYELNWQLQDDNAAEGTSASLTLTWEADNT